MKKRTSRKNRESGWMTVAEICRAFDVAASTFVETVQKHIPAGQDRGRGRERRIHCRSVIDAWVEHRAKLEFARSGGDPDLLGSSSPNLERYRKARAESEEIDVAKKRGLLVERKAVEAMLDILKWPFHRVQERGCQTCVDVFKKTLANIERTMEQKLSELGPNPETESNEPPAASAEAKSESR